MDPDKLRDLCALVARLWTVDLQERLDSLSAAAMEYIFDFLAAELGSAYNDDEAQLDISCLDPGKVKDLRTLVDNLHVQLV